MNNKKIWDITPVVTSDFPLWPGSEPLKRAIACDIAKGDVITSSSMSGTVHLGAHADAPSHYHKEGKTIDACSLEHYLGLCQVIHPKVRGAEAITKKLVNGKILAPRILFRTDTFDPTKPFQEDFAALDPDFFEFMAEHQVITIGIDTPSVDLFKAEKLPCHQLAFKHEIAILENLDLQNVPEGLYELIALPLKIKGFDASPVRAILRDLE